MGARQDSLLGSDGTPRYVRVYGDESYAVIFTGNYGGYVQYASLDEFGQAMRGESPQAPDLNKWGWAPAVGKANHLGRRITFGDLPLEVQRWIVREYRAIWGLGD